jgi:hypothetical protein
LDRPFIVDIRTSLGILANDLPSLALIIRERELASTTTMARLREASTSREFVFFTNLMVPEADFNDVASFKVCYWAHFVAAYSQQNKVARALQRMDE